MNVSEGDKNISINEGWNLIGYSSETPLNISLVKFYNGTDVFGFREAVQNNKLQAYFVYYNSSRGVNEFVSLDELNMQDVYLREGFGYWVSANEAGVLSLEGVGGNEPGQTYEWSKLRFSNGTDEKSVSEVHLMSNEERWIQPVLVQRELDKSVSQLRDFFCLWQIVNPPLAGLSY